MFADSLLARIQVAREVVTAQVPTLREGWGQVTSLWKADGTRVTASDLAISRAIGERLATVFPGDQFFSEETSEEMGRVPVRSAYSWLLDPIDGTNNYAKGLPHCAIALALLRDGEPIYGVIYDLARGVLMEGGPGHGMRDGARGVSGLRRERDGQPLVGFHSPMDQNRYAGHAEAVATRYKLRGLGSSTLHLAYVAAGLLDGVVDHNVKLWDIAAAIPLVRAVGGEVRFLSGSPLPLGEFDLQMSRIFYVAGLPAFCDELQGVLPGGA
jgi:myo-inositol-1(or 4)-monophosphatase